MGKAFLKIVVVGDSNVGKTSLIHKFATGLFRDKYKATIGSDFLTKEISANGSCTTIQIWDTAGQERFRSIGTAYYRGADAAYLVFDVTNQESFENLEMWKSEVASAVSDIPCILLGNKCDLSSLRVVSSEQAKEYCESAGMLDYFDVSVKNDPSMDHVFIRAAEHVLQSNKTVQADVDTLIAPETTVLSTQPPKKKGGAPGPCAKCPPN
eukprot:TRINITY_DN74736_c0_g1_i1.p1 TRINITY_DN74736_c0_g1~~TRINITY_DN74736_c0_g1_i1.p1  ORF type:complete len:210 (-),score=17.99 TRINITY_DN74736_c0_g1_i1:234-863(-)